MDEVDRILSVGNVDTGDVFTVDPLPLMHEGFESSQLGSDRGPVRVKASLSATQLGHVPGSRCPDLPPSKPRKITSYAAISLRLCLGGDERLFLWLQHPPHGLLPTSPESASKLRLVAEGGGIELSYMDPAPVASRSLD